LQAPEWGRHGGHGYGACNGYTCVGYTCYGSPGCYGGCFGYNACYGYSSFGGWGHWPYTSYGGGYGGGYGGVGCTGCYGCYGGYGCYGMPFPGGVTYMSPGMNNPIPPGLEVTPLPMKKIGPEARAKVRVELPEDAKLYVDGVLMKTTAAVRNFQTPNLEPNRTYYYELKAELIRDNQAFTEVQRIVVRPGEQASASFAGIEQRAVAAGLANPATAQR
jgi:uncharacterized protein (TIGR03000 family)